jgi:hypothetical protein
MQGVQPGQVVQVDPDDPYIAKLLRTGYLVLEEPSDSEERSTSVTDEA